MFYQINADGTVKIITKEADAVTAAIMTKRSQTPTVEANPHFDNFASKEDAMLIINKWKYMMQHM